MVNFYEVRDFGQNINALFEFLKTQFKPLFMALLRGAGIFLLISALAGSYYQNVVIQAGGKPYGLSDGYFLSNGVFLIAVVMFIVSSVVSSMAVYSITLHYIKAYIRNPKDIDIEAVVSDSRQSWGTMFGITILFSLIVGIGIVFCIAPGIYLAVALSLAYPIAILEDGRSVGEAFSRSRKLIQNNWWSSFGYFFVVSIIFGMISSILSVPTAIFSIVTMIRDASDLMKMLNAIAYGLQIAASALLGAGIIVGVAVLYGSLRESVESVNLAAQIDSIGRTSGISLDKKDDEDEDY
ncbi:hypothetical protein SAMN05421780_107120 [Flexibacter flexilis DSM 6793]|uniref:DUF7847 domain-containing protein n=1 Tax=Flexibacter flexilis DSM 6793 TaxID=927664 RepID=A0A1I1KSL3_9BACT|nr:hypothetical protein [Flexibacter flexilis]SFC61688.1 hypothetical protein SAMN05421780_107120 [Flexibacter flexilis DSM 6793]